MFFTLYFLQSFSYIVGENILRQNPSQDFGVFFVYRRNLKIRDMLSVLLRYRPCRLSLQKECSLIPHAPARIAFIVAF